MATRGDHEEQPGHESRISEHVSDAEYGAAAPLDRDAR
jgi:hypothetical protein